MIALFGAFANALEMKAIKSACIKYNSLLKISCPCHEAQPKKLAAIPHHQDVSLAGLAGRCNAAARGCASSIVVGMPVAVIS